MYWEGLFWSLGVYLMGQQGLQNPSEPCAHLGWLGNRLLEYLFSLVLVETAPGSSLGCWCSLRHRLTTVPKMYRVGTVGKLNNYFFLREVCSWVSIAMELKSRLE